MEASTDIRTLVYRSQAVRPFSTGELLALTRAAQVRNRAESITGLILYDDSRFFQWLEGPDDSLSRVMDSIHHDRRHTNLEILLSERAPARSFGGWDMKLALPDPADAPWAEESIAASARTVQALRLRPETAAAVLVRLAAARAPARKAILLEQVVRAKVVPELARRHGSGGHKPPPAPSRAAELAELAREGRTDEAIAVVRQEADRAPVFAACATDLVLAAARTLGDLWLDDECSEFETTLGVGCLQLAVRRVERSRAESLPPRIGTHVLVAPLPGEPHRLTSVVSDQLLRGAGWDVRCAFPSDDAELGALLASEWFDNLDLSLSPAFRREDRMARLCQTIVAARAASRNPGVAVTVSGRIFADAAFVAQVGADGPTHSLRGDVAPARSRSKAARG